MDENYLKVLAINYVLDLISFERGDAETKGVWDQLLEPNLLLLLLLLVEVLHLLTILSKYFLTNTLVYALVTAKVNNLIEKLHIIKDSLSDTRAEVSKWKFFNKAVSFLHISGQKKKNWMSQHYPNALVKKFLA